MSMSISNLRLMQTDDDVYMSVNFSEGSCKISISYYKYSAVIGVNGPSTPAGSRQASHSWSHLYESNDKCILHNATDTQGIFTEM